jgi:hypothetical protein
LASPDPLDTFATKLTGLANIYARPTTKQLALPAIVLRPDEPMLEPGGYGWDDFNFVAVCVVGVGGDQEATTQVKALAQSVKEAVDGAFWYKDTSGPFIDKTTGIDLLAVRVRLMHSPIGQVVGAYS